MTRVLPANVVKVPEIAAALRCSPKRVRTMTRAGKLPQPVVSGGQWLYRRDQVEAVIGPIDDAFIDLGGHLSDLVDETPAGSTVPCPRTDEQRHTGEVA